MVINGNLVTEANNHLVNKTMKFRFKNMFITVENLEFLYNEGGGCCKRETLHCYYVTMSKFYNVTLLRIKIA